LRDLHIVHGITLGAQKSAIPVQTASNFVASLHFCDVQNHLRRIPRAIQIVANLETANKS